LTINKFYGQAINPSQSDISEIIIAGSDVQMITFGDTANGTIDNIRITQVGSYIRTIKMHSNRPGMMTINKVQLIAVDYANLRVAVEFTLESATDNFTRGKIVEVDSRELNDEEVRISLELSSINPADLFMIMGAYRIKPSFPAIPGSEGVGKIIERGSNVTNLQIGDRVVIPFYAGVSTWGEEIIIESSKTIQVPLDNKASIQQIAMASINPPSAYYMLTKYEKLEKGDWIIQNAANSAVGSCVIGFAKLLGLKTINIVRREEVLEEVKNLGGDIVLLDGPDLVKRVVKEKNIYRIDFNQGVDCRLMTEKKADLIKGLPIFPFRFAFDGMHEDGYWQRATKIMIDRGYKRFTNYVLFNFKDTSEDFYYRLKLHSELSYKYKAEIDAFPMKYKPILNIQKQKNYVGINWTKKELSGFNALIGNHSGTGIVSTRNRKVFNNNAINEFEYFYGKNEKEFKRLINYENIRELCKRKSMKNIIKAAKIKK